VRILPHKSRTKSSQFFLPHSYRTVSDLPHNIALEKLLKIAPDCEITLYLSVYFMLYRERQVAQNRSYEQH
jgi:hypothetical protein